MNHADKLFQVFLEKFIEVNGQPSLDESNMLELAFFNGCFATTTVAAIEGDDKTKLASLKQLRKDCEETCNKRMAQTKGGCPSGNRN